tara:strand:+ start:1440 stop:1799 length:360 start_codon:yes stop_codon:yes gene_type:complete
MKTSDKHDLFNQLFTTSTHGCSGECQCGVFHYDTCNEWDEDHRLNTLPSAEASAKEFPDNYQFQENAISYVNINGFLYVIGCKCRFDNFIFEFLTEEKQNILSFYIKTKDEINAEDVGE